MNAKKFRLCTTKLLLTYPRCSIEPESMVGHLRTVLDIHTIYACREFHADNFPHLHAAVLLTTKCDIKNPNLLDLPNMSLSSHGNYQPARNLDASIDYVKKRGDWIVWTSQEAPYKTKAQRLVESRAEKNKKLLSLTVREAVDSGFVSLLNASVLARAKYAYDMDRPESNVFRPDRRCFWVFGAPGCGKSAWARAIYGKDLYYKTPDKWWDGYKHNQTVLLEDLDPSKAKELVQLLKLWADRYDFSGEMKGGRLNMTYTYFIVTSNFLPADLWRDSMLVEAITRRFEFLTTEIESFEPFSVVSKSYQL